MWWSRSTKKYQKAYDKNIINQTLTHVRFDGSHQSIHSIYYELKYGGRILSMWQTKRNISVITLRYSQILFYFVIITNIQFLVYVSSKYLN